jgi:ankyrin repeat domain-containing protein 50
MTGLVWRLAVIEEWYQSWLSSQAQESGFPNPVFEDDLYEAFFRIIEFRSLAICYLYRSPVIRSVNNMSEEKRWDQQAAEIEISNDELGSCSAELSNDDPGKPTEGEIADQTPFTPSQDPLDEKMIVDLDAYQYRERKDWIRESAPRTCEWFCSHARFQSWKEDPRPGLLLVTAEPGCGKSVLAKHLIDHIFPNSLKRETFYVFFENDFPNFETAILGMIHQLFLQSPDRIHRWRSQMSNLGYNFNEPWQTFLNFIETATVVYPGLQVIPDPPRQTICIIDGIDKCDSNWRTILIETIRMCYHRSESREHVPKILVTSRPDQELLDQLLELGDRLSHISLSGTTDQDIEKILKETDLVVKACAQELGTLLRMTLVFDELKKSSRLDPIDTPEFRSIMPLSVDDRYEEILRKDYAEKRIKEVLKITSATTRSISMLEMISLLTIGGDAESDEDVEVNANRVVLEDILRDISPSVVSTGSRFHAVHPAVHQFLISRLSSKSLDADNLTAEEPLRSTGSASLQPAHQKIAERCIRYLTSYRDRAESGWLLNYASVNWVFHFRSAKWEQEHDIVREATQLCDPKSDPFKRWTAKCRTKMPALAGLSDALTVASYLGLELVVELLLATGSTPSTSHKGQADTMPLYWASCNGHAAVVRRLLQTGAKVDARAQGDECDETALVGASTRGHLAVVKLLLDADAEIEATNYWDHSSLFAASAKGHATVVKHLLDTGAQVNVRKGRYALTPLHQASIKGYVPVVDLLLDADAEVNLEDDDGKTPLSTAVGRGHWMVVSALLDRKANLKEDRYLLYEAIRRRFRKTAKLLLAAGARINTEGESYPECLCLAATLGDTVMIEELLKAGANVESTCQGETALFAAREGDGTAFEQLLKAGANANATMHGSTVLHYICRMGKTDMARQLLKKGADINARDETSLTPLHSACRSASPSTVRLLLDAGADVDAIATIYGHSYVTPFIDVVSAKCNTTRDTEAREAIVKMLLDAGAHVDAHWEDYSKTTYDNYMVDENHGTPLCIAAHMGHEGIAKLLLEANAQIHFDGYGASPLALAFKWGKHDIVELLYEAGAQFTPDDQQFLLYHGLP